MKKALLIAIVIMITIGSFAQRNQIKVNITGIKADKGGVIKVGLYTKDGFPSIGKENIGKDVKVNNDTTSLYFYHVTDGAYALAVFQDTNNDGKLNTNLFGAPTEPYGFSQNKYGTFGPPKFADVSFEIKDGAIISIMINLE